MTDAVIIGGGPAGLFAGRQLARAGFRVTLIEEHAGIGEPVHCTGVLAADAFDAFNLPRTPVLNELRTVRFALVDLPRAALRRDIESGVPPPEAMQRLLLQTCAYVLRHTMRRQPQRRRR